jgi:protein-tyrosine-phosphatase
VRTGRPRLRDDANHRRAILAGLLATGQGAWRRASARPTRRRERKVELLDPDGRDIPDPIGGSLDDYRRVMQTIERALERRVARFV